jgi:hypothetical protein
VKTEWGVRGEGEREREREQRIKEERETELWTEMKMALVRNVC